MPVPKEKGLIDTVNDWDIAVECPKEKLIEAIHDFDWKEEGSGDYPFASRYRISISSMKIDFIGYFALFSDKGVIRLPVRNIGTWDGINISSPEIWYVAYSLMKRERKAKLILEHLRNNNECTHSEILEELINNAELCEEIRQNLIPLIQ